MDERDVELSTRGRFDADTAAGPRSAVNPLDRWALERLMNLAGRPPCTVTLWDARSAWRGPGAPVAELRIADRATLYSLLVNPELRFGVAYTEGRLAVEGDLLAFLMAVYRGVRGTMAPGSWKRTWSAWLNRPRTNTVEGSRENIHRHYDLGNAFYRLWLDEHMVYTCAYYARPDFTLEQAQVAKLDHVCRKLRLRPGQRVAEAGCGWGALALHMASAYGVRVRAFNISTEQVRFARARARALGLEDQVEFVEADYREIDGQYDVFVSVGMLEHVGVENYRGLGAVISRCLRPGGRGLVHSIGRNHPEINNPWIERYIFPGSRPPALSEMSALFEPFGLSVLDIENLRLHYALTCREWLRRFERVTDQVQSMYDESFVRAWRLYLNGSVAAFETGTLQLFQVVFAHEEDNALPLTRDFLYTSGG